MVFYSKSMSERGLRKPPPPLIICLGGYIVILDGVGINGGLE
jgi:hypothetical protein